VILSHGCCGNKRDHALREDQRSCLIVSMRGATGREPESEAWPGRGTCRLSAETPSLPRTLKHPRLDTSGEQILVDQSSEARVIWSR